MVAVVPKLRLPVGRVLVAVPKLKPPVAGAGVPKLTAPVGAAETIGEAKSPEDTLVMAVPPVPNNPVDCEAVEVPGVVPKPKFGVADVPDTAVLKDKPPVGAGAVPKDGVAVEKAGAGLK